MLITRSRIRTQMPTAAARSAVNMRDLVLARILIPWPRQGGSILTRDDVSPEAPRTSRRTSSPDVQRSTHSTHSTARDHGIDQADAEQSSAAGPRTQVHVKAIVGMTVGQLKAKAREVGCFWRPPCQSCWLQFFILFANRGRHAQAM